MTTFFITSGSILSHFLQMSIFSQLKQQLSQQLPCHSTQAGLLQLQATVAQESGDDALLAWLKAQQTYFPHFFWQSRERCSTNMATLAAIGAVRQFKQLEEAQQFVENTGFTLIGGVQFQGEPIFILPRLLIVQRADSTTAYLNIEAGDADAATLLQNIEQIAPLEKQYNPLLESQSAYGFEQWRADIHTIIQQITDQKIRKAVLANQTTLKLKNAVSAYDLLASSQTKNHGCYHFLWAENAHSAFIGSTPERLYQRNGTALYTEALAGTALVSPDREVTERNALWLLSDAKNRYENQLVVDDICNHLAGCVQEISVEDAAIKRLNNVQHLRRLITATLKSSANDADCLSRVHPTAAVAGLPRLPAKALITQLEPFERDWYAGTLGFFNRQQAEFCVTIRSAQITGNQVKIYAGAGIVDASEPQTEWQEIERKAASMMSLFK